MPEFQKGNSIKKDWIKQQQQKHARYVAAGRLGGQQTAKNSADTQLQNLLHSITANQYLSNKNKKKLSFDEKIQVLFEYCDANKKHPKATESYKNVNIGKWLQDQKRKISSKGDDLYIKLAKNEYIEKSLDQYLLRKNKNKNKKKGTKRKEYDASEHDLIHKQPVRKKTKTITKNQNFDGQKESYNDSFDVVITDEIIIKKEIKKERLNNDYYEINLNDIVDEEENEETEEDGDVDILTDNINDGVIYILEDNINIKYCPKCKDKVTRTDKDIQNSCSIMTCRKCGDERNYTYWCWDCAQLINMNELRFNPETNEPGGACKNCRKLSRKQRNKCKKPFYNS